MNYPSIDINTSRKLYKLSDNDKEAIIYKLSSDLEDANKKLLELTLRNIDLRKSLLDYNSLKEKLKSYEESLEKNNLEKIKLIKEKDDKNSQLFKKISFLENTVEINRANYEKNNILYQQKMSQFNTIEKENKVYAEEKANFEKEKKLYQKKKDDEVERYKVRTDLKYEKFKKKMDEDLKIFNQNLINESSDYINANHKLLILQNRHLYEVIARLEKRIADLEKENEKLRTRCFESENSLKMQKMIEKDLSQKIESNRVIRLTRNKSMANSISLDNNISSEMKLKTNNFNKSEGLMYNPKLISNTYTIGMNRSQNLEKKISEYKKLIEKKKYENDTMLSINTHLKNNLNNYQNKFNGLFNFFEESLNNFCNDEEIIKNKNFYIKLDKIKKCNFNSFSKQEKYALLVLLMKYLLPLININFNSYSNLSKNLFKTNLNIVHKKFNMNESFLNDETLRHAFLGKNKKIFQDIANPRRTQFSSSVPILKGFKKANFNFFEQKNKAVI